MWRFKPAPTATERGIGLSRTSVVRTVRHAPFKFVDASVDGSCETEYFVFGRWFKSPENPTELKAHFVCSCPDKRQGYCKHAAAVLEKLKQDSEASRPKSSNRPSWLASAYSSSSSEKAHQQLLAKQVVSPEIKRQSARLVKRETALRELGVEECIKLLMVIAQSEETSGEAVSKLYGGTFAQSQSYQTMSATRWFDLRASLSHESVTLDQLVWGILYLVYDLKSQVAEQAVDNVVEKAAAVQRTGKRLAQHSEAEKDEVKKLKTKEVEEKQDEQKEGSAPQAVDLT